jgi:hypothetical protein
LKKIGAHKMADIVDRCQALVDEHFVPEGKPSNAAQDLLPTPVIGHDGKSIKDAGSTLPESILQRIYDLSYEFMDYPDNVEQLGLSYYRGHVEGDGPGARGR